MATTAITAPTIAAVAVMLLFLLLVLLAAAGGQAERLAALEQAAAHVGREFRVNEGALGSELLDGLALGLAAATDIVVEADGTDVVVIGGGGRRLQGKRCAEADDGDGNGRGTGG